MWTLWDTYLGFLAVFPAGLLVRKLGHANLSAPRLVPVVGLVAFVAVELDVMVRVFLLIVGGLYQVYPIPIEALPAIFVAGAFQTPLEAAYTIVTATVVGVPLLIALEKSGMLTWPFA